MIETITYLAFIPPIMILLVIIVTIIYNAWYRKHYITDATDKYAKGWHKCWKCKISESTMYYTETIHGRIYKCLECSKKDKDV
jgi:hypothetical protein